jgi:hypothetical protein
VVIACTGTLSENQKKRIKESMEQGQIKKLTESQITEAAFAYGRSVAALVEKNDKLLGNSLLIDSIAKANNVEIISLQSENNQLRGVEKQLLEAYLTGGSSSDNIQKEGTDSLIYTKPILREHPDGSTEFLKAIGIRMTRKQVVLSIEE